MADCDKACPRCGAMLHLRLGVVECPGCGYSAPDAGRGRSAGEAGTTEDPGSELAQVLQGTPEAQRTAAASLLSLAGGGARPAGDSFAVLAAFLALVAAILFRGFWRAQFYLHQAPLTPLTGQPPAAGGMTAELLDQYAVVLLVFVAILGLAALITRSTIPAVRYGLSLLMLAGLCVACTQLVLSLFGRANWSLLADAPSPIRISVAGSIVLVIFYVIWRLRGTSDDFHGSRTWR